MKQAQLVESIMEEIETQSSKDALRSKIDCLVNQHTRDIASFVSEQFRAQGTAFAENISQTIKQF